MSKQLPTNENIETKIQNVLSGKNKIIRNLIGNDVSYTNKLFHGKEIATMEKVLDCISNAGGGITVGDIAEQTNKVFITVQRACNHLLKLNCISEGIAPSFVKRNGEIVDIKYNKKGYLFENDFDFNLLYKTNH